MKKLSFLLTLAILIITWCMLSGTISKKGNESLRLWKWKDKTIQDSKTDKSPVKTIVFEDLDLDKGLEITDFNRRRFIQLCDNSKNGHAEKYFFDSSAKYDISIPYIDDSNGKSVVEIFINGISIGNIRFDEYRNDLRLSSSSKEKTLSGINVQQWSKIALVFSGDGDEKCRIEKLVFTPVGEFDGKSENLEKPLSLKIYNTADEQLTGHRMFTQFVRAKTDSVSKARVAELAVLKSPSEWKAKQTKIREQLFNYFGKFPERTPLNARSVGKLEYDNYSIEKVIFESQPHFYVPANLYIPKGRKFPLPGVLFTCGHTDEGKAAGEYGYTLTCIGLALKGYVVLIFDPIGQGERSEYFDKEQNENLIRYGVEQHHYVGKPAFLAGWTLSGLRTWDAVRALDYLESRPEVDKNKLASVGQSGGGEMALLITSVDKRIKVCAASGPGGSMEQVFLNGARLSEKDIISLIPPRPLKIIYGNESGEEPNHRERLEYIQRFYDGLGVDKQYSKLVAVPGGHTMNRFHREEVYEWLNKWFNKESEGKAEGEFGPEKIETLWCTKSGNTIVSLGGETGQTLNAKRARQVYKQEKNLVTLKERIARRIGLSLLKNDLIPEIHSIETLKYEDINIEKLTYESEKGILIPALLLKPENVTSGSPVYICASDKGKPIKFDDSDLPFKLAKNGFIVLAIDVRGIGETSPTPALGLTRFTSYTPLLWTHDMLAIDCASFKKTTLGMRTLDVLRGIDVLYSREDLKGKKIVVAGEGLGGLWALLASVYDSRITGVVTVGTLPSYMMLLTNKYYNVWGYFFVPGALFDFDIPDLARLVSPKPQIWIDPVNELGQKLDSKSASSLIGVNENLYIFTPDSEPSKGIIDILNTAFYK